MELFPLRMAHFTF